MRIIKLLGLLKSLLRLSTVVCRSVLL